MDEEERVGVLVDSSPSERLSFWGRIHLKSMKEHEAQTVEAPDRPCPYCKRPLRISRSYAIYKSSGGPPVTTQRVRSVTNSSNGGLPANEQET